MGSDQNVLECYRLVSNQLAALSAQLPSSVNRASSNSAALAAGLDDNVLFAALLGLELRCDPGALDRALRAAFCLQRPGEVALAAPPSSAARVSTVIAPRRRGRRARRLNPALHEEEKPVCIADGLHFPNFSASASSNSPSAAAAAADRRRRTPLHTPLQGAPPASADYLLDAAESSPSKKYRLNPANNSRYQSVKRAKRLVEAFSCSSIISLILIN